MTVACVSSDLELTSEGQTDGSSDAMVEISGHEARSQNDVRNLAEASNKNALEIRYRSRVFVLCLLFLANFVLVLFYDRVTFHRDNLSSLTKPYQPGKNFVFPKTQYKLFKRAFQSAWFDRFPWLHYDVTNDAAFCFTCIKAISQNLITSSKIEQTFVTEGFRNWKKACEKNCGFYKHQQSDCHLEAAERYHYATSGQDIGRVLSSEYEQEKETNRTVLLKILSNVRYLGG